MNSDELKGAARELGGEAQAAVGDLLGAPEDQVGGRIKQMSGQIQRAYGTAADEVTGYVQKQPVTTLLITFAVGVVLGALITRR